MMRQLSFHTVLLAVGLAAMATPAFARTVTIPIDQAKIIVFDKAIATAYVGNPSMADVTVIDPHRIFVLGKAFGTTNLIALDRRGHFISNDPLKVEGHVSGVVTLNRGAGQYTFACAGTRCEAAPVPGDVEPNYYGPVMSENQLRQSMGTGAANVTSNKANGQ